MRGIETLPPELRYMDEKAVLAEFRSRRERKAMAALWSWLSLNGLCAWNPTKRKADREIFDTVANRNGERPSKRLFSKPAGTVIENDVWERGRRAFGGKRK